MSNKKIIGIALIFMAIVIGAAFSQSKNPLANTQWEGYYTGTGQPPATIVFEEKSFTIDDGSLSGTYTIDGSVVILNIDFPLVARIRGTLIGGILTIDRWGYQYIFERSKQRGRE